MRKYPTEFKFTHSYNIKIGKSFNLINRSSFYKNFSGLKPESIHYSS